MHLQKKTNILINYYIFFRIFSKNTKIINIIANLSIIFVILFYLFFISAYFTYIFINFISVLLI